MSLTKTERMRDMLRDLLKKPGIIMAPHAYDGLSAKLIESTGFDVVHVTGAGVSATLLGQPDVELVTMTEMVTQVKNIVQAVNLPVIADADTGYGNAMNVMRTVREFEQAGVAAMRIEDQVSPKKCGHTEGRSVISKEAMVQKIKAALEARQDEKLVFGVRCDSRAMHGLEDALERGHAYFEAGIDYLSIEAPESIDDVKAIAESFRNRPLYLNMTRKKTPHVSTAEAAAMGYKIIGFPGDPMFTAAKAIGDTLKVIKETGSTESIQDSMLTLDEFFGLLGLKEYYEKEARFTK